MPKVREKTEDNFSFALSFLQYAVTIVKQNQYLKIQTCSLFSKGNSKYQKIAYLEKSIV